MKKRFIIIALFLAIALQTELFFSSFISANRISANTAKTHIVLTDGNTGRKIFSEALQHGETIILTWNNSLFRLKVTEVFIVRDGHLEQTSVTFSDPKGGVPPIVKPEDVDDLYHTGGPFKAEGLSRPIRKVTYRIGEIGDPIIKIGNRLIRLAQEVGFGGSVILEVLN